MFTLGDKVRLIKDYGYVKKGKEGVIRALPGNNGAASTFYKNFYSVEFPAWNKSKGHSCGGTVPSGNGQWVRPECLELVEKQRPGIGDRIKMVKDRCGAKKGMTGKIVYITGNPLPYGVEFEEKLFGGHGCAGTCKYGYGHWLSEDDFEVITENNLASKKIVITHDGKTTLARLYEDDKVIKSATAKCSPDDTFDFATGAKLAFERLTGEKKEEPPKFDKSMLTNGRFGYMSGGEGWFVVVGDKIVYEEGGYDLLEKMTSSGSYGGYEVKYIVDAWSFNNARQAPHKVIWCAPDFDPDKVIK